MDHVAGDKESVVCALTASGDIHVDVVEQFDNWMTGETEFEISGGSIETDRSRFGVQPSGELDAVAQIERIVVGRDARGAAIYLSDLGIRARRTYADPPRVRARYGNVDGTAPCVVVSLTMKKGAKVTDLGSEDSNRLYTISAATNLAAPFSPVAVNIPATPPENAHTVTVNHATRFYRVSVGEDESKPESRR